MHVHRDDNVKVLAGRDRGKTGRVIHVFTKEDRVLVEKVNMVKRHTRPNQQVPQGGIVEKEAPMFVCKVKLICPKCATGTRIRMTQTGEGKKARVCLKCKELIDG